MKNTLLLLVLFFSTVGKAQVYPVQTNISSSGPYFNYLSYYADENNHLQAIVTLTDFNSGPIQARLRITIEGPGYDAVTNPNIVVGNVFTLEPGIPNFINGIDLAPYLLSSNLLVTPSGIDLNNLPEGFTTICVDVIRDGTNQEIISTNNCTSFFLQRFQPPQAVFPACASNVNPEDMFYTFQWTPPVGFVPAIGTELNYTFSLYEWNDPNNYTIFQTGQGLVYTTQTANAVVQLSNFDVLLQEGKDYVWRIEAMITNNGIPVDMIENNGVSAPCTFTFGASQTLEESLTEGLLIELNATGEGESKGKAFWTVIDNTPGEGLSTYSSFMVSYRKKPTGSEGFEITWLEDTVSTFNHLIYQLEASTAYEVFVQGIVGNFISEPSETVEFTTLDPRIYACGEADLPYLLPDYNPLANALVGMRFQIGQFTMQVTEITPNGALGHYKGKGLIPVAFLGGAKAKVRFDDILVDDQYIIREGQVDVVTKGLENWLFEEYMQFIDPYYVEGEIDSAYVENGTAWVVVEGETLGPYEFDPPEYPVIVNDENGNQYTIWPDGTIETGTYLVVSYDYLSVGAEDVAIFVQNNGEKFGFDGKEHIQWHENYEVIRLGDSSYYFVANKSVGEGLSDVVDVIIPSSANSVTLKLDGSTTLSGALSGNTITIPDNLSKGKYAIYIYSGTDRIGKLNLQVYSKKEKEVVFVPITNGTLSQTDIEDALRQTFGEANIDVHVTIADQWNNSIYTTSKLIEAPVDVGLLSKYSDDMRSLRDAYFDSIPSDSINKNAYYIFVVPGFSDGETIGYMVRGRALGFIKAGVQPHIYAHELAHGIGALQHAWDNNGPARGTTTNLMDYSDSLNPTSLAKFQWKEMRDMDIVPSLFDGEEDAAFAVIEDISALFDAFHNTDSTMTFLSIGGGPITLKGKISDVGFVTPEDLWEVSQTELPMGALAYFTLDGIEYKGSKGLWSGNFKGYKAQQNDGEYIKYVDSLSFNRNYKNVIGGLFCLENGNPTFMAYGLSKNKFGSFTIPEANKGYGIKREAFDFFYLFFEATSPVEVYAKFTNEYEDLLLSINNYVGADMCGVNSFYAFKAAKLLKENPEYAVCLLSDQTSNSSGFTELSITNTVATEDGSSLNLFYTYLNSYITSSKKVQANLANDIEDSSISNILAWFNVDKNHEGMMCTLSVLPMDLRLKMLSSLNHWQWSSSSDKERFLVNLITTVPKVDIPTFIDALKSENYKLYWSLYGDLSGEENDAFVNAVTWLILGETGAKESFVKSETVYTTKTLTNDLHVFKNGTVGQTTYSYTIEKIENGNMLDIEFNTFTNYMNGESDEYIEYFQDNPFDLVKIRFRNDFQFNDVYTGSKIRNGDEFIVPAIWLYWLLERQNEHETMTVVRVAATTLAAVVAIATMEPGPLLALDLFWAGTDIVVARLEDDILSSDSEEAQYWLSLYNTSSALYGGGFLVKSAGKLVLNIESLPQTIRNLRSNRPNLIKYVDDFKLFYTKLKDLPLNVYVNKSISIAKIKRAFKEVTINKYVTQIPSTHSVLIKNNDYIVLELPVGSSQSEFVLGHSLAEEATDLVYFVPSEAKRYDEALHGNTYDVIVEFDHLPTKGEFPVVSPITGNTNIMIEVRPMDVEVVKINNSYYVKLVESLAQAGARFIARSGDELVAHLDELVILPTGKIYNGDVYRSLSVVSETNFGALPTQMTDHHIYSSWGRYDLAGQENAMYLSKTLSGNETELVPHYGAWADYSTYKFSNVQATNILDLTDDMIRQQLGTQFDDLIRVIDDGAGSLDKTISYEMTNVISKWARDKGYNGLIVPGARGANNYENVIIFDQTYVNQILQDITPSKIIK